MQLALERTTEENEVGFERHFRAHLRILAKHATLERKGAAQYEVSAPNHKPVFASLRLQAAPTVLQEFKKLAPAVRKTLLGNSADWLKRLGRDGASIDSFLEAVHVQQQQDGEEQQQVGEDDLCPKCGRSNRKDCLPGGGHHCRMVVKFRCPQCKKSWTTQKGRFSIREDRILHHDCSSCRVSGTVVFSEILTETTLNKLQKNRDAAQKAREEKLAMKQARGNQTSQWWSKGESTWEQGSDSSRMTGNSWQPASWKQDSSWESWQQSTSWHEGECGQLAGVEEDQDEPVAWWGKVSTMEDDLDQTNLPRIATEQHRSDLCEACKRYGDCGGVFVEPFQVFAIAKILSGGEGPGANSLQWRESDGARELTGFMGGPVRLLPHIYEESAQIAPDDAAVIVRTQRDAFIRQNGLPSGASSSHDSQSISASRSIRTSEDDAMRLHFKGKGGSQSMSASRSIRTSEDDAMRRHFKGKGGSQSISSSRSIRTSEDDAMRRHFKGKGGKGSV
jgi:hypothetical protein